VILSMILLYMVIGFFLGCVLVYHSYNTGSSPSGTIGGCIVLWPVVIAVFIFALIVEILDRIGYWIVDLKDRSTK